MAFEVFKAGKHMTKAAQLELFFRKTNVKLVNHLCAKGLPKEDAQGIAQETYIRLLDNEETLDDETLKALVYKVATNIAIDRYRRKIKFVETELTDDFAMRAEPPVQEDTVNAKQNFHRLQVALEDLPPKCQVAFWLYKVQGLDYAVVAQKMNISESMVRKYVLRAVRHCFDQLKDSL